MSADWHSQCGYNAFRTIESAIGASGIIDDYVVDP